ncbi:sensor histidine kinase [Chitinophaga cymbidii]|uniref:Signal transduction histidine kinase internal region domain-containing protein n=1 Tax=Chitinophaga cymbidii TaxID=1096750 RepID=A0A512RQM8_9BACT|nr:histidine kinase [Chitinophaga cymbidii]GEP97980.1 hypothetical protein CCY01nite_42400 [Chitinophaga cymbidii]
MRYFNISLHVLIWGSLLLLPYFISTPQSDYRIGPVPGLFFTLSGLIHMGIFYGHAFYLYPKLYNRRLWWLYLLSLPLLLALSFGLKSLMATVWFPDIRINERTARFIYAPSVGALIISIVYRNVLNKFKAEKEQKERQAAQLQTELKFLRSQVNPHFLFNVLTNLVALARKKSDRLEPALIMLSDLMRYMLYDSQGKKVPLQKEIGYLESYIALQKLRFGSDVEIYSDLSAGDNDHPYTIEPMLLIPFIENAFKHGIDYIAQPEISIRLAVDGDELRFEVINRYQPQSTGKDESSGIGLTNVKARLELLYRNRHKLIIHDRDGLFHITLTLKTR